MCCVGVYWFVWVYAEAVQIPHTSSGNCFYSRSFVGKKFFPGIGYGVSRSHGFFHPADLSATNTSYNTTLHRANYYAPGCFKKDVIKKIINKSQFFHLVVKRRVS